MEPSQRGRPQETSDTGCSCRKPSSGKAAGMDGPGLGDGTLGPQACWAPGTAGRQQGEEPQSHRGQFPLGDEFPAGQPSLCPGGA